MKIKVTQEHINKGRPGSGSSCPIALAIKDALNAPVVFVVHASVNMYKIYGSKLKRNAFRLDKNAVQFQKDFDHGFLVQPITVDLTYPTRLDWIKNLGRI